MFLPDEHWIGLIAHAKRTGHLGQVLLSHDAATYAHGLEIASGEHTWDDYTYILRTFVPRLRAAIDLTEEDLQQMLVVNPQRVLTFA
jgi:predicted metal-dependent phosphotriesterase family hydrolase